MLQATSGTLRESLIKEVKPQNPEARNLRERLISSVGRKGLPSGLRSGKASSERLAPLAGRWALRKSLSLLKAPAELTDLHPELSLSPVDGRPILAGRSVPDEMPDRPWRPGRADRD